MIDHADERLLAVDAADAVVGTVSKWEAHRRPGTLHRAFSLLLFSDDGERLLLQRRAAQKLLFPLAWANTCCSHPREGETAVAAARRKAVHELNLDLAASSIAPLTRVLYRAAFDDEWEEYELDHIVVARRADPRLPPPNPEEVAETRWVTADELREMRTRGERFSPWFALMCDRFLDGWWRAAKEARLDDARDDAIHDLMPRDASA